MKISLAHSPDSDDAFMFYGLARGKVPTGELEIAHVLADIETLNRQAQEGRHEITAISFHAYPYVADKYALMPCGGSIGDGYGPLLVAREPLAPAQVATRTVAVPGTLTTAYLFGAHALHKVLDLGAWWKEETGLPLPLGGNAVRRDLGPPLMARLTALVRDTVRYSLAHRREALDYALGFARGMDPAVADRFVGMWVNDMTVECGSRGRQGVQALLDRGHAAGVIPRRVTADFVDA